MRTRRRADSYDRRVTNSADPEPLPIDPFVTQLASLCVTQRTRVKWVFVPTHALGRTLGEGIALAGTDWLNLRFVTPLDIALRMGAPFLVERGIDPSEEGLGPALMMRLLLELPEQGGYFRALAEQPSLAGASKRVPEQLGVIQGEDERGIRPNGRRRGSAGTARG